MLSGLLSEYNFKQHVASDIGIDEQFIPATSLKTQKDLLSGSQDLKKNLPLPQQKR